MNSSNKNGNNRVPTPVVLGALIIDTGMVCNPLVITYNVVSAINSTVVLHLKSSPETTERFVSSFLFHRHLAKSFH